MFLAGCLVGGTLGVLLMSVIAAGHRQAPAPEIVDLNGVRLNLSHAASVRAEKIRQWDQENRRLNYAGGREPDEFDWLEQSRV